MARRYYFPGALFALFVFLATPPAAAQLVGKAAPVNVFLKIDGVDGESTDADHKDWIVIDSYSHGLTNEVLSGGGGGGTGAPRHSPIVISKRLDKSSPRLFDVLNKGEVLRSANFEFLSPGQAAPYLFLRVELENAYVTSYSVSVAAGDDRPTEEVAFTYNRITMTYWPQNPDGTQGPPITVGWDVGANMPTSVEMVGVRAWVEGREVVFGWQTASQTGNYGFEVQKLGESGFSRAAYVPGAGWSREPLEYEVRIRGLTDGVHVFRLASLGVGGSRTYSEEISLAVGVPDEFALLLDEPYPNPFSERLNVSLTVDRPTDARVSLFDMLGREVAVIHDGRVLAGFKARYTLTPARPLAAGSYVLQVLTPDRIATRLVTSFP